jgi:hypothetical protein
MPKKKQPDLTPEEQFKRQIEGQLPEIDGAWAAPASNRGTPPRVLLPAIDIRTVRRLSLGCTAPR